MINDLIPQFVWTIMSTETAAVAMAKVVVWSTKFLDWFQCNYRHDGRCCHCSCCSYVTFFHPKTSAMFTLSLSLFLFLFEFVFILIFTTCAFICTFVCLHFIIKATKFRLLFSIVHHVISSTHTVIKAIIYGKYMIYCLFRWKKNLSCVVCCPSNTKSNDPKCNV